MRGTGNYNPIGMLNMKYAVQLHTNKDLYRKQRYVCWQCQKSKKQHEVKQTLLAGVGSPMKIVCHECRDVAQQKKDAK